MLQGVDALSRRVEPSFKGVSVRPGLGLGEPAPPEDRIKKVDKFLGSIGNDVVLAEPQTKLDVFLPAKNP